MILVMRMKKFEVEHTGPIPVELNFKPMVGFLPVYETLADAKQDYPDGPFQEMQMREKP